MELLIVLSVILILAAIAVPQYLNARIRSQVAIAHSHLRNIETGLEWYASDQGSYPTTAPQFPSDSLALLADHQLRVLTSPIRYLNSDSLTDPFGLVEAQFLEPRLAASNDFPQLSQPNAGRSLLYYHYPSLAARLRSPLIAIDGAACLSIGPDKKDSIGAYRPFGNDFFSRNLSHLGYASPLDTLYSPTNGTVSGGDIPRFAGQARRFQVP